MVSEAPDPKTFQSWEEAFQYPIAAVRGMERQLHRDIDSNREKLRTLVGASYRDLLGTAESIIEMDGLMHNAETYMGDIGQMCNSRILEKKGTNLRSWTREIEAPNSARYAFASQLSILRSCPDVISMLFKSGGSVLLAAKVLVISRLLHTKLCQFPDPPPYLGVLRKRLASLRRRLLVKVDRRFSSLELSRDVLIETMCAFSLATSSSPKDVLRHFHHVRLEAISENMDGVAVGHDNMLLALRIYFKTLRDTQTIVPGQLAHALEKLKAVSLFKSSEVSSLMELNLDVHGRWTADDIKTFMPYIRHDDLSKTEAERSLKQWARQAFSSFLDGLKNKIQGVQDPLRLVYLRREVINLWLSNHQHSVGIDSAGTLDGLRDVFNLQSTRIIKSRASTLAATSSVVQEILQSWQPGISGTTSSLWGLSITSIDIAKGGMALREELTARSAGKNASLLRVCHAYTNFLESIEAVEEMIKKLRETRWAEDVEDVGDEDDLLDNKQVLLSEDDPGHLQEELNCALRQVYEGLEQTLSGESAYIEGERGAKSSFLIRVWREIRLNLPKSYKNSELGLSTVQTLQFIVGEHTLRNTIERLSKRFAKTSPAKALRGRQLWEGDPALPVLPSAWTYRFLLDLVSLMSGRGSDVWSTQATDVIKQGLMENLAHLLEPHPRGDITAPSVNGRTVGESGDSKDGQPAGSAVELGASGEKGDNENDESESSTDQHVNGALSNGDPTSLNDQSEDAKVQRLFDIAYLVNATATKVFHGEDNKLMSLQTSIAADLALEPKLVERLSKDAGEYWKRTSLLFALLA